jgi:HK97 family phage prohead protease
MAAVFNSRTELHPGFFEVIERGAFSASLAQDGDVVMLFNHDPNYTLARRSNGTLIVAETEAGLRYAGRINRADSQAMSVHAKVARGDVKQSSFGFLIRKESFEKLENGGQLRRVLQADLWDVSPVTWPAYADTEAQARMAFRNANEGGGAGWPGPDGGGADDSAAEAAEARAGAARLRKARALLALAKAKRTRRAG